MNHGNEQEDQLSYYKRYRNKLNHLLRTAERKYYKDLILEHKSNLKKSWQILKMIINKRKSKPLCKEFKCNGETIKDDVKISNKFNNFFVNVGSSLASGIPPSTKNATDFIRHDSVSKFYLTSVTEDEI